MRLKYHDFPLFAKGRTPFANPPLEKNFKNVPLKDMLLPSVVFSSTFFRTLLPVAFRVACGAIRCSGSEGPWSNGEGASLERKLQVRDPLGPVIFVWALQIAPHAGYRPSKVTFPIPSKKVFQTTYVRSQKIIIDLRRCKRLL